MLSPILSLCARVEGSTILGQQLNTACDGFTEWDSLLSEAESHGMAPLLQKHLSVYRERVLLPDTFLRGLRFLCLRHQQANLLLAENLRQILVLLEQKGIPSLILKGGALSQTLYPEIGLRPMRDIDILLSKEDADFTHTFLQQHGFVCSTEKTPQGYYHLPALLKTINGMQICVELHHGLFPDDPPYYQQLTYEDLYRKAKPFNIGGTTAYSLGTEDMLYHLYQHGFHAPLTFEPYKLISVADIVSLVEQQVHTLDWDFLGKQYPQVVKTLPLFHYLTPWSSTVLQKLPLLLPCSAKKSGAPYQGWPRVSMAKKRTTTHLQLLRETLLPGRWWLMLYYNPDGVFALIFCRLVQHPLHLLRWVKIYGLLFLKKRGTCRSDKG